MQRILKSQYSQIVTGAALMLWLIYTAGFGPPEKSFSVIYANTMGGWIPGVHNGLQRIVSGQLIHQLILIICTLLISHFALQIFARKTERTFGILMAVGLFLSNPLLLWSAQSVATVAVPILSLGLWLICARINSEAFSRSSVIAGVYLAVFVTATPTLLHFSIPLISAIALLLPLRLVQHYGVAPFVVILAPLALSTLAMLYWQVVMSDASGMLVFTPVQHVGETEAWLQRHDRAFATAVAELLVWGLLICPMLYWMVFASRPLALKRLAFFSLAVPIVAAGLATDLSQATTPLPYLSALVTAQAALSINYQSQYVLASLYVSWLGSAFAIWYYVS